MRTSLATSKAIIVFALMLVSAASWLLIPACSNGLASTSGTDEESDAGTSLAKQDRPAQLRLNKAYGKLPLSFEANHGQCDPRVKFISHAGGQTLFLTSAYAVLKFGRFSQPAPAGDQLSLAEPDDQHAAAIESKPSVLRMKLVGANHAAKVGGLDELPGKSNYFIGNDPKKWRTGVISYAKVQYREVYPGIDIVYYGNQGRLEYDLKLAPGANPKAIRLSFEGAERIRIDRNGDLVLSVSGREFLQNKPIVYQEADGMRKEIACRYVAKGKNRIAFGLSRYDTTAPLVIDPVLSFSTYLGGSESDGGQAIAVDSSGNAYVAGFTYSPDFPAQTVIRPPSDRTFSADVFVTKMNSTGTALVYSTYLGGNEFDGANGIAVDGGGNVYLTGVTNSNNFPTLNPIQSFQSVPDAFITKLNSTGSALVYSTYLGGDRTDDARGIAVDVDGSAYVTGVTSSRNFPTVNAVQSAHSKLTDAFITKVNSAGSALVYSTYLGGSGTELGRGIAVDSSGNAYVTGSTSSPDFPTKNAFQSDFKGKTAFKSANDGANWNAINNGLPASLSVRSLAVDPADASKVYAGTTDGFFRSTDGGGSWMASNTGLLGTSVFALAIDPVNTSTLFAATTGEIFKSTDGGISWATSASDGAQCLSIDPTNPSIVYAGSSRGVLKTANGGGIWAFIRTNPIFSSVRSIVADPSQPSTLYAATSFSSRSVLKSTDMGSHWTVIQVGLDTPTLAIDPVTPSTIYVGCFGLGVLKSTNGGNTFDRMVQGLDDLSVSVIAIDPVNPATIYVGTQNSGVFKTSDGASHWSAARSGLTSSTISALAIARTQPSTVFAGTAPANDGFVVKLSESGGALTYSTYLGGDDFDTCAGIALDGLGNVYVAGGTSSLNLPAMVPVQASYGGGSSDAFIAKLNAAGTALVYSTYLGGSAIDFATGIAVDQAGAAYVTGATFSTNFPVAVPLQPLLGDALGGDAFVAKLGSAGTLLYSTFLGGTTSEFGQGTEQGNAIAVDRNSNCYITGETLSTDFPVTPGAFQATRNAFTYDAFVVKISDTTPFDICLQDQGSGNILRLNSATGEYVFTNCSGLLLSGTGLITKKGCLVTLQVNGPDRRLVASMDVCAKKGTASIQVFSQRTTFTIFDRNTANHTCACRR